MKKGILIAALAAGATALTVYLVRRFRNRTEEPVQPVKRNPHLTNAFARAKSHAQG